MKFVVHRHSVSRVFCTKVLLRRLHGFSPLTPLLYAETCYFTKALQYAIEGIHSLEIPWVGTFMFSGVLFRFVSLPLHVYAERLSAERYRVVNTLNYELIKKFSKHYGLNVISSENGRFLQLDTTDKSILQKTNKLSKEIILDVCWKRRLQLPRIQYLRFCALSIWTFSSFAIRNVISSETGYPFQGILWFPDLLQPDPYYVIPISVGILGIFNYFAQQRVYAFNSVKLTLATNACYSLFMIFGIYFMSYMPVCIPLFWLSVSLTGSMQHFAFRHPKIKKFLGIKPLPSDSATPLRDVLIFK
uniref:Mitochondrial inner membrane protein COX18 n=1 Tax=Elaeophora elaphi TaxID=1147741 RepID=A0A0R3RVS6_9BILA